MDLWHQNLLAPKKFSASPELGCGKQQVGLKVVLAVMTTILQSMQLRRQTMCFGFMPARSTIPSRSHWRLPATPPYFGRQLSKTAEFLNTCFSNSGYQDVVTLDAASWIIHESILSNLHIQEACEMVEKVGLSCDKVISTLSYPVTSWHESNNKTCPPYRCLTYLRIQIGYT